MENDLIVEFCGITGASTGDAAQYLEMSEGDMQRAVDLYLDMGSTANQAGSPHDTQSSGGGYYPALFQEDDVRAAIPAHYDQMIGGPAQSFPSMEEWLHGRINIPSEEEVNAQNIEAEFERAGLGDLYSRPDDINFPGSFADAIKAAKDARKWLLVNIQAATEFSSHTLNRDVWKHETVKEVIRSSFIFWQRDKSSPQATSFVTNHHIAQFPVVCIIDPRTGRKAKQWFEDKLRGPFVVTDLLADFMGANPFGSAAPKTEVLAESAVCVEEVVEKDLIPLVMPTDLPEPGAPDEVKVAIRLSNGVKKQVSFRTWQPLAVIQQWVSATEQLPVSKFQVRISHPPQPLNFESTQTVAEANVRGALLLVAPF